MRYSLIDHMTDLTVSIPTDGEPVTLSGSATSGDIYLRDGNAVMEIDPGNLLSALVAIGLLAVEPEPEPVPDPPITTMRSAGPGLAPGKVMWPEPESLDAGLDDCVWWADRTGQYQPWARVDCGGRLAVVRDALAPVEQIMCENHVNAWNRSV